LLHSEFSAVALNGQTIAPETAGVNTILALCRNRGEEGTEVEQQSSVGIAILGLGTIGSAVAKLITKRRTEITESYGLDLTIVRVLERGPERAARADLSGEIVATDFSEIIEDPNVNVVVETLGGELPAADFIERSLRAGKHVITANKEALSKHFDRLQRAAHGSGTALMFEASVGGGIPLLVSYRQILAANRVVSLRGILNGTTNYILTQMTEAGESFGDALKRAQDLGYAEPDPTADVEGYDAAYKLSILASIMAGRHVHPDGVDRTGITRLGTGDIEGARMNNSVIKLLAQATIDTDRITARVGPETVPSGNLLAHVSANFNAIEIAGDSVGPVVLSGQGAGPAPTASAIVSDVVEAVRAGAAANVPWT
jgi:homoserine dehydrogenase